MMDTVVVRPYGLTSSLLIVLSADSLLPPALREAVYSMGRIQRKELGDSRLEGVGGWCPQTCMEESTTFVRERHNGAPMGAEI